MRYLSVCDGIGAVHLAWQRLGWRCVGVSEIAPFPAAVVEHHFGFRNLGDMTRFREWPERLLADVDLLVGGTPCQSFSVAGKRRSLDDERGNLTRVFVDLFHHINRIRRSYGRLPAIAFWENVPGVLTTPDNAFGHFVGGLLGCDEAPQTESGKWRKAGLLGSETVRVGWRVLDAQHFAVAQRRRRVFLLAVPCELVERFGARACPSEILALTSKEVEGAPTRGGKGQETHGTAGDGLAGRIASSGAGTGMKDEDRVAWAIDGRNQSISKDLHHTLRVGRDSGDAVVVASSEVAGTLTATRGNGFRSDGTPTQGLVIEEDRVRSLTPREWERLQGFPDDYTLIPFHKKRPAADSLRYTALGNSMAVPILRWAGVRIAKAFTVDGADTEGPSSEL